MARKKHGMQIVKLAGGLLVLVLAVAGLTYASVLREMQKAETEFNAGDTEAALKRYQDTEARLRSTGAFRLLPQRDQRDLVLNEARMLYALAKESGDARKYDEAADRLEKGSNELVGLGNEGRYLVLKGNIAFRKAVENYRASQAKDPRVLEEALLAAEDHFRNSLRNGSSDWDAKYNYEYINYIRNLLSQSGKGKMNILMENVKPKEIKKKTLAPEQQG